MEEFYVHESTRVSSKKKRCEIRLRVVYSIDQIARAHRNRYKYYYFSRVIVLSTMNSLRKNGSDKDLFAL
jgi:hypothetical protein